jgi:hypothetical protein
MTGAGVVSMDGEGDSVVEVEVEGDGPLATLTDSSVAFSAADVTLAAPVMLAMARASAAWNAAWPAPAPVRDVSRATTVSAASSEPAPKTRVNKTEPTLSQRDAHHWRRIC